MKKFYLLLTLFGVLTAGCSELGIDLDDLLNKGENDEVVNKITKNVSSELAVDLGLSVKWSPYNIGANSPEEYGNYYSWAETAPKAKYVKTHYSAGYEVLDDISGNPKYDAATANWGEGWRMPTQDEYHELMQNCSLKWTKQNDVSGIKITGTTGNSIFIPAAGCLVGTKREETELSGVWTGSFDYVGEEDGEYYCSAKVAYFADFDYDTLPDEYKNSFNAAAECYIGIPIRPIYDK